MPRLVHKLPSYFLHKPSGRARVRYHGVDRYLPGPYGSEESRKAYSKLIDRLMSPDGTMNRDGTDMPGGEDAPAPSLLTIAELIEKFWDYARNYYRRDGKPTGEHEVIRFALRPLLKMFGAVLATEFKPRHLKVVRKEMIRLDWSRRHINASVRRIRRMFNWAVEEELIPPAVAGALATVKALQKDRTEAREKPKVQPVPDEVVEATLPHVSKVAADIIRVMRLSGARPGEMTGMRADQIDRNDPDCWRYAPPKHKTSHRDKRRVIFLGPRCQAILAPYMAKAGGGKVFPMGLSGLRSAVTRGCAKAGVPHWHPNQLRHSAATEIRKKFGLEGSQVILGHSRAATTEIYAEVDADRGREIACKIG
jgi:integrase